jgi:hypothetical protein
MDTLSSNISNTSIHDVSDSTISVLHKNNQTCINNDNISSTNTTLSSFNKRKSDFIAVSTNNTTIQTVSSNVTVNAIEPKINTLMVKKKKLMDSSKIADAISAPCCANQCTFHYTVLGNSFI